DQAIEDRLPVLVTGKVVVGNEETMHALAEIEPDDLFDVIGRAAPGFPALHIDDGAERALIGATAPGTEAGEIIGGARNVFGWHEGDRRFFDAWQIIHEIVERLHGPGDGVAEHGIRPALKLAGKETDAEALGGLVVGI